VTVSDCAGEPVIGEPDDHAIARSRGGLTTKVHALSDGAGRLLVVLLTAGNVHGTTMLGSLLAAVRVARTGPGRPRTRPEYLVAQGSCNVLNASVGLLVCPSVRLRRGRRGRRWGGS